MPFDLVVGTGAVVGVRAPELLDIGGTLALGIGPSAVTESGAVVLAGVVVVVPADDGGVLAAGADALAVGLGGALR